MNYMFGMNLLDTSEYLFKNKNSFLESECAVSSFWDIIVEVAHVAVLQDQEIPFSFCIRQQLPSNVFNSLTMFGWLRIAIVFIYCKRKRFNCWSLIIFFLDMHLIAKQVVEEVDLVARRTCPNPPLPNRRTVL